ncbi:MAG: hypothetical protein IKF82_07125 [Bacilli bacterium]|nr:hypothetical protein [Bacilli bacterium]
MRISDDELLNVYGGGVSSTFINAIVKGIFLIVELGKSLGSSIRRVSDNKICEY